MLDSIKWSLLKWFKNAKYKPSEKSTTIPSQNEVEFVLFPNTKKGLS